MNEAIAALAIFALTVAFAAGTYVASWHFARKQINGLGGRVNHGFDKAHTRMDRLTLALVHLAPPEQREEVIRLLMGSQSNVVQIKKEV